jgi:hypothetical protein
MSSCGYAIAPRLDQRRWRGRLWSLSTESAGPPAACCRSRGDPINPTWARRYVHVNVVTDSPSCEHFFVSSVSGHDLRPCNDLSRQQQRVLVMPPFDALGLELPRPHLRIRENHRAGPASEEQ